MLDFAENCLILQKSIAKSLQIECNFKQIKNMASVKFYLDKRNRKQDGSYPLKLTVTHKKPFHVSINLSIQEENWIDGRIEGNIPNKKFLNSYISAQYSSVENLLLRLKIEGKLDMITADDLKKMIVTGNYSGNKKEDDGILGENYLFRDHAEKFIETRLAEGTKKTYRYTMDMLQKYCDLDMLTFCNIDFEWLENLEATLRKTIAVNTISIHMRNIRAIFTNAMAKKLVSRDLYPFHAYSIKNEETAHRDLSVTDLRTIRDYPVEPHQERYRDFFMLLFYLIGINTVDILHAKGIRNGRLEYRRAKTGKLYSIKVEPEAMAIIKKYPGKKCIAI